jgi:hypothetical protein
MIKHFTRKFTLALSITLLAAPTMRLLAQSTPAPTTGVTGTDPEPQIIRTLLLLYLA